MSCPSCGRQLDYGNHVLGTVISHDDVEAVVELLFSCRGCLSILRDLRRHARDGLAVTEGKVTCAIPGARAHREIERLQSAAPEDRVLVFREIAADPERRALLRVPEVFGTVRALYRGPVALLDAAVCGWRRSDEGIPWPPLIRWASVGREMSRVGRLFQNPFSEADREAGEPLRHTDGDDEFLLLPAGHRLALHQATKNVLLVVGPGDQPMAAAPDLAVPE